MSVKSLLGKLYAKYKSHKIYASHDKAEKYQQEILIKLVKQAKNTLFGLHHNFDSIKNYDDYINSVPLRDYESFSPYIKKILHGDRNILWPGIPLYLAKTSGTTSGAKYIPISKESMPEHVEGAKNAILMYIAETGKADFIDGKWIFLQGSPELTEKNGIKLGRLSGIAAHYVPSYLQKNRLPSWEINCIDDWEQKVDAIVKETSKHDMTLISGIPPWLQMYFDGLTSNSSGKKIKDIFPNFSLLIYGGVNFEPYKAKLNSSIGKEVDSIETYPASEGFIAFQDSQKEKGMLLNINAGIFYEFIKVEDFNNGDKKRISLKDIELNQNYAIVLTTNAGLWSYLIGDTIKFVSKKPYRILVTGRLSHFISAFGEHVIVEEVEKAILAVSKTENVDIVEFTVAPQVNPDGDQKPFHEWFIEFGDNPPSDIDDFRFKIDAEMQKLNIYYLDLIKGNVLQPLKIVTLPKNSFIDYMKSKGKLGGQNKVPRLSNDRNIVDELVKKNN